MTRWRATAVVVAMLTALAADVRTKAGAVEVPAATHAACGRYHYSIAARIRPLLVFWLSRSGIGDAVATRRQAPGAASYSLLIGSDPERAPRGINRWGYIDEEIRGAEAHLVGLMTESEEETVAQAEETLKAQAAGRHPFKVIHGTVNGERASSRVTSIAAAEDYTFRQVQTVLGLAERKSGGRSRVVQLPPETRPGFLVALADAMHAASPGSIRYVYDGRLYELRATHVEPVPNLQIAGRSYGRATAADFVITSEHDGRRTPFSMTYGAEGRYAEVPLTVTYQPRWWMQVSLTIENVEEEPVGSGGAGR